MYNYLIHHGIKGMKWGVRRYRNKDGSLTPAGKRRYYYNGELTSEGKKVFDKETEMIVEGTKNVYKKFDSSKMLAIGKEVDDLANELKDDYNRFYSSLKTDKDLRFQVYFCAGMQRLENLGGSKATDNAREDVKNFIEQNVKHLANDQEFAQKWDRMWDLSDAYYDERDKATELVIQKYKNYNFVQPASYANNRQRIQRTIFVNNLNRLIDENHLVVENNLDYLQFDITSNEYKPFRDAVNSFSYNEYRQIAKRMTKSEFIDAYKKYYWTDAPLDVCERYYELYKNE